MPNRSRIRPRGRASPLSVSLRYVSSVYRRCDALMAGRSGDRGGQSERGPRTNHDSTSVLPPPHHGRPAPPTSRMEVAFAGHSVNQTKVGKVTSDAWNRDPARQQDPPSAAFFDAL